jgi:hypothetical protein
MERTRFVEHAGQQLLLVDFAGLTDKGEALAAIAASRALVAGQPEASLLTLTDVTDMEFDEEIAKALWELMRHNKKHVRAGAVVGLSGERQQDLYDLLTHQARRELPVFETPEEAKAWLVREALGGGE